MRGNSKLREVLSAIMDAQGDTASTLSRKSGVPASTICRFLLGIHGEPRGTTLRKLADAYAITESQLRGEAETHLLMDSAVNPVIPRDLASMLTADERKILATLRTLPRKSREAWITIGQQLTKADETTEPVPEQGEIFTDTLVRSEPHPEPTRNNNERIRAKA